MNMPAFRPLYQQVAQLIRERISSGRFRPGEALPSEMRLAEEFGVSQGTLRKSLDVLEARNLLERHQGRGTFVVAHTAARSLFHFFHLVGPDGRRQQPTSRVLDIRCGVAGEVEARRLAQAQDSRVVRIDRVRSLQGRRVIAERIVLPEALFGALARGANPAQSLPNTLYDLYQREFGVTISHAREWLRATSTSEDDAHQLGVATGTPVLEIDRLAFDIEARPVEWRLSRCLTQNVRYVSELD